MEEQYSVLMSVYHKEKAENLKMSMDSIWNQTLPTDNFVLVCDGVLSEDLDKVIQIQQETHKDNLFVVRLEKGVGLGKALNHGMQYCKHDVVARMDSDDISKQNRMEKQLQVLYNERADIVGTAVEEFDGGTENVLTVRKMPQTHQEIMNFVGKRNPFNHPSIMYRKSAVMGVGGYLDFPLFEDYYLWARMLKAGYRGYNIPESLLYMRAGADMYQRRGGWKYAILAFRFRTKLKQMGVSGWKDYLISAFGQLFVCLIPNKMREKFYQTFLRR
ncbi:MAG: glycosyltransferase [Lachnospiraceae bacterium]|nr:glycosyltransferase [Lachnospiraceae bacterium]